MLQTLKNKSKRIASTLAAGVLLFSQFVVVPQVGATNWHKVTICHATGSSSNPYTQESVDDDAVDGNGNGSSDHNRNDHQNGEDIIPPTSVDSDSPDADGRNWTVTNQKIWANDCETTRIEVRKIISPSNDTGLFNLKVDEEHDADTTVTNVGNNGTTGEVYIDENDDVKVAETPGANTSLDDYTTTISCVNQNGSVTLSSVDVEGSNRGAKIDSSKIKKGDSIVCTFTNSAKAPTTGSLVVKKNVINDNKNTKKYSDFHYTNNDASFALDADATDPNNEDGVNTTSFKDLPAGTSFNIVETDANTMGYTTTYNGCTGTIEAGVTKVCAITNDDQDPLLTLQKIVVKDNGGTAYASDWTLKAQAGDNAPAINAVPSIVSVNTATNSTAATAATDVAPGSYTLSETGGPSGYAPSGWTCDGGTLVGNTVTVTYGDHVTCTITNDDIAPLLTVNKNVFNNNGGTANPDDFKLTVGGLPVLSGVQQAFNAGTYTVGETQQDGYSFLGFGGACDSLGLITLALGGVYTCNLTNDDQPAKITVTKKVVNDNGGKAEVKDFTLYVGDEEVVSGETNEFPGNQTYEISEDKIDGYKQTNLTCVDTTAEKTVENPFKAELGHNYECTIVNNDKGPKLMIVKKAFPWWSEQEFEFTSEELGDFSLYGGDHEFFGNLQTGEYTVTEQETEGWYLKGIRCYGTDEQVNLDAHSVTVNLELGDFVVCVFTNGEYNTVDGYKFEDVNGNGQYDEDEPKLQGWTITIEKLCKENDEVQIESFSNENEGGYNCESFEDSTVTDENGYYSFDNLKPGLYKVCEVMQDGWTQTAPGTDDGCETVWVWFGDEESVWFGNFELGKVTGIKFNDVNGNGKRDEGEPTLKNWEITLTNKCEPVNVITHDLRKVVSEDTPIECEEATKTTKTDENGAYSFTGLEPGDYVVCEIQQANWTQTFPADNNGCHDVTIVGETSGEVVTADFGNKPKPQVLSETTTQQLVNTGASTTISTAFGLVVLSVLATVHFLARRKSYQD